MAEPPVPGTNSIPEERADESPLQEVDDNQNESSKHCWVCFGTELDDRLAAWVQPCSCRGTGKWVHQECLQRWVDEKQKGNVSRKVLCPQCQTEYIVVFPSMGHLVNFMDCIDDFTHKMYPFMAGGALLGSIYWTAMTYGAVTLLQVVGHKEGLSMMEQADPLVLLVLLPTIPVALICAKMFNWEDSVLYFLRRNCRKIPALTYILPFGEAIDSRPPQPPPPPDVQGQQINNHEHLINIRLSPTRVFCGALLLPTISSIVGRIFFDSVKNNLHRTIIGGLSYLAMKGVLKIYHKQMIFIRQSKRKIVDYNEENLRVYRRPRQ